MFATQYTEAIILNTMRGVSTQAPQNLFIGLFFSSPGDTGTAGTEISYAGYQRRPITFSAPATIGGFRTIRNTTEITFATTTVEIGVVGHLGVFDAQTGGNCVLYGQFLEAPRIEAQEAPVIGVNEASWWLTGNFGTQFADRCLNWFRGQDLVGFSPHVALFNGNANTGGLELSGNTYARIPITFSEPQIQSNGASRIQSSIDVESPRSTGPWGVWDHTNIMEQASGGIVVAIVQRFAPKQTKAGIKIIFRAGQLAVQVN